MSIQNKIGFGRLIIEDDNDKAFPMQMVLPQEASQRTSRYWYNNGWWGDQGNTSQCVGYSWAHWVEDGPVTQKGKAPIAPPTEIYRQAQMVDAWPGENYDGTSVRAGAKVLQDMGFISSYTWAWDINTVVQALLEKGPVVVGTHWYEDMIYPSADGIIKPGGDVVGGHAYLLNGVNTKTRMIRIKNSWGKDWGKKGQAYISFDDMDKLIKLYGEACLPIEIKK